MTLLQLRDYARRLASMEGSLFISDAELNDYINDSYKALYDLLILKFEDYFLNEVTFSLSGSNNQYTVPSDFYKLRGLDKHVSGNDYIEVTQFMFEERNRLNTLSKKVFYRLLGNKIHLLPIGNAPGSYRLFYIPLVPKLVNNGDSTVNVLNFHEYIAIDAALKMLAKEETVNQALENRKLEYEMRIDFMSSNRVTEPQRIIDTRGSKDFYEKCIF